MFVLRRVASHAATYSGSNFENTDRVRGDALLHPQGPLRSRLLSSPQEDAKL